MMHSLPLKQFPSILAVFIIYYDSTLNSTSNYMHTSPVKISVANIASVVNIGALDGGSPMSFVEFKKWQCPLSLFLNCPCRF